MAAIPKILAFPNRVLLRRHEPDAATYQGFRPCLRWEYGFVCIFCMRHERDMMSAGVESDGITSAEHYTLQKGSSEEQKHSYENVVYCCMRCNRDRWQTSPEGPNGERLLCPTSDVWSNHFVLDGDDIQPVQGDQDAKYTYDAYKPNRGKKSRARRSRRLKWEAFEERYTVSDETERFLRKQAKVDPKNSQEALKLARAQGLARRRSAIEMLRDFGAIPIDAPKECKCKHGQKPSLPKWLLEQCETNL